MKKPRNNEQQKCIGFGDNEGQCENLRGRGFHPQQTWSFWCDDCETKRRAHISNTLNALVAREA